MIGPSAALAGHATARSAIDKRAVDHAIALARLGFAGDEQADTKIHGGPDKAVHVYAWQHYSYWRSRLPHRSAAMKAGAFGENLSVAGMQESDVCIGDQWAIGTAILEVSQGRQPCWKLNARFGTPDMAQRVQNSLKAGWYCRVLQSGIVSPCDEIFLVHRPHPQWHLEKLLALIRDRIISPATLAGVLELPLTDSWRRLFTRRLVSGAAESWETRMDGPVGTKT